MREPLFVDVEALQEAVDNARIPAARHFLLLTLRGCARSIQKALNRLKALFDPLESFSKKIQPLAEVVTLRVVLFIGLREVVFEVMLRGF